MKNPQHPGFLYPNHSVGNELRKEIEGEKQTHPYQKERLNDMVLRIVLSDHFIKSIECKNHQRTRMGYGRSSEGQEEVMEQDNRKRKCNIYCIGVLKKKFIKERKIIEVIIQ